MRVLVLADIDDLRWQHGSGEADLILALGDTADSLILEAAQAFGCTSIFAVKGNHDSADTFPKPIVDLDLHVESFGGLTFGGLSGSWKYKPAGHFLYAHDEVREMLADFPHVDVFVSHNSPLGIHDKTDGIHAGFAALTEYIHHQQPRLLIHGHQHVKTETKAGAAKVIGVYGHRLLEIG